MTDGGLWTIRSIINWSQNYLQSKDIDTARLDSELLLSKTLGCSRVDLYVNFDKPLSEDEKAGYRELLKRRAEHEPVAYIIGEKGFYKYSFQVGPGVLIPRPDTEVIVERAIEFMGKKESGSFIDIGTGSGCIGLSLAKEFSNWQGVATDISKAALEIFESNKKVLNVNNVNGVCHDVLSSDALPTKQYDLIVSNPPYICETEKDLMSSGVERFEPAEALFAEDNGLLFYQAIGEVAKKSLSISGALILEIGFTQGDKVKEILLALGFEKVEIFKDYGRRDRGIFAIR